MVAATKTKHSIVAIFLKGLLLMFLDKSFKKLIELVASVYLSRFRNLSQPVSYIVEGYISVWAG